MTAHPPVLASGVATALLAGPWSRRTMVRRVAVSLGYPRAPRWVGTVVGEVLDAHATAPADRPRELALFVAATTGWAQVEDRPRVLRRRPRATSVVRDRFGVVPLPDAAALARLLDLDQGELAWFADVRGLERTADEPLRHYRWHTVERRGGLRLLAEPKPRLKEVQRRLLRHVLGPVPVHDAAHGCVPGRSVRTAAAPHAGSAVVLGMDLEAFFASVSAPRVWGLLQGTVGLTEPVAHLVTGLVTTTAPASVWQALPRPAGVDARDRHRRLGARLAAPHLPQGAPTSPALANLVCFRLDRRLAGLAAASGARYTRYVDDLTFSGDHRTGWRRFAGRVAAIAAEEGFRVNPAKTRVAGAASRQRVLGTVVNARPTLPRPERDALRALLHNCARHGWAGQTRGHDPATFRDHVLGRVAWAASLDPVLGARLQGLAARIDWS
ncbi:reverse transcriptase family protein [Geodermatophilus sp. DSM 44513]|uniref:reverse transcriptase family protein n=1 Tax=Geodermatophilus sp. DSM 44513 TaxID=1528104 RepID=UPI0012818E96|nr:reverse transcriptase family protein [Geodermatophilus sp. DSM 44513]WNV77127.1 reverse transcriptase family protein [Geodermatophilus sp. DSM 44513]